MASKATPNAARRAFVKASGLFGKYTYRTLSYVGENAAAFLGLTATIAGLFLVSSAFGITVPVIVAAAESAVATLAGMPLLAGTVALAAAIAAPETLKKIYKECTGWVVKSYKAAIKNLFTPKSFDLSDDELAVKQAKHQENPKYETKEAYKAEKEKQYSSYNGKTADLDVAGNAGKRTFKAAANAVADSAEWVASVPGVLYSYMPNCPSLPCFSFKSKSGNGEPLLKGDDSPASNASTPRHVA